MRSLLRSGALRTLLVLGLLAGGVGAGASAWSSARMQRNARDFVSGTGHIEGTEVTVATRITGRIENILVAEGQFVHAGELVGRLQAQSLLAERDEAVARYQHALYVAAVAETEILVRESESVAAEALVRQRDGEFHSIIQSLANASARRHPEGASEEQGIEDPGAAARRAAAAASAADAQLVVTRAAVSHARLQRVSARAAVAAAVATIRRIETQLAEMELRAPRDGVVEYRLADRGELLSPGGRLLELVDPTDVSLAFLLPEAVCDRVTVGSDARIALDGAARAVTPATISFVGRIEPHRAPIESGRASHDAMCRVRARMDPQRVLQYGTQVKTGATGVGWVKLDSQIAWPPALTPTR